MSQKLVECWVFRGSSDNLFLNTNVYKDFGPYTSKPLWYILTIIPLKGSFMLLIPSQLSGINSASPPGHFGNV